MPPEHDRAREQVHEICRKLESAEMRDLDYVGGGWQHDMENVCRIPADGGTVQMYTSEGGGIEFAFEDLGHTTLSNDARIINNNDMEVLIGDEHEDSVHIIKPWR